MLHVETGPLHIFPKATPGLAEVVAWLGRPQRGGYTLSFSPRKGWVIADFLIDDLCSISLDASALVVETVWVIVTYIEYIEVTLTPVPLWSRRCGLQGVCIYLHIHLIIYIYTYTHTPSDGGDNDVIARHRYLYWTVK